MAALRSSLKGSATPAAKKTAPAKKAAAKKTGGEEEGGLILGLDVVDVVVVQTHVVADLMDQDVGDDLGETNVAAFAPFVQDRATVQEDAAGLGAGPKPSRSPTWTP